MEYYYSCHKFVVYLFIQYFSGFEQPRAHAAAASTISDWCQPLRSHSITYDSFLFGAGSACRRLSFNQMFGVCFCSPAYGWQNQIKKFTEKKNDSVRADCTRTHQTGSTSRAGFASRSHRARWTLLFDFIIAIRIDAEEQFSFSLSFISIFHFLCIYCHGISGEINSDVNSKLNGQKCQNILIYNDGSSGQNRPHPILVTTHCVR